MQSEPFDIILLDLDMPIMSGYEACTKIVEHFDQSQKLFKVINRKRNLSMEESKDLNDHNLNVKNISNLDKQIKQNIMRSNESGAF